MQKVRPKKHLGQHFLRDLDAAQQIVNLQSLHRGYKNILEIGPGMGVLTQYLLQRTDSQTSVVEIDRESVAYLKEHFPTLEDRIFSQDFLQMNQHHVHLMYQSLWLLPRFHLMVLLMRLAGYQQFLYRHSALQKDF